MSRLPLPASQPMAPATAGVLSLRRRCLHALAAALVERSHHPEGQPADQSIEERVQALPPELQQELLLVLAGWQLLDAAACALLTPEFGDDSSCPAESILAGLDSLSLAGCALLSSASLRRLLCCPLPQLEALSLKGLPWLTDADAQLAVQHCPNLRRLDLSGCPQLTAAAVHAVAAAASAPQLQSLSLSGCWQIAALPGLAGCTQLTSLALACCWQLTEGTVQQVGVAGSSSSRAWR